MRSLWRYQPLPAVTVSAARIAVLSGSTPRICPPRLWPTATTGRPGAAARASASIAFASFSAQSSTVASKPRRLASCDQPMPR